MNSKVRIWSHYGTLALNWCHAFLGEQDYIVLALLLEQENIIVQKDDFKIKLQKFMNIEKMIECLYNLKDVGLVMLSGDQQRPNDKYNQHNNFTKIQVNDQMLEHLTIQLNRIDRFQSEQAKELEKQKKSPYSRECKRCSRKYTIVEVMGEDITKCRNPLCYQQVLEIFKIDEKEIKNTTLLGQIVNKLRELLEQCKDLPFPSQDDFTRRLQAKNKTISDDKEKPMSDKQLQEYLISQRQNVFRKSIRKRIYDYVKQKKALIQSRMELE